MQKSMASTLFLITALLATLSGRAQETLVRMEPPNWWAGMEHNEITLLMYGEDIANYEVEINRAGARLRQVIRVENPNYLFLDLVLDENIEPGNIPIRFLKGGEWAFTRDFPILTREEGRENLTGFDASDVIYLVTPDRFANGDPGNDAVAGMKEKPNRKNKSGRHGGDLEGIAANLDYLEDMGFTALWLNPVIENDMPDYSYHGYAATDFYRVDARFGTNEDFRDLCRTADKKGMKVIMDMIMNHCGSEHWFVKDPPASDWINFQGQFVPTSHMRTTVQDIHASAYDKRAFSDGWFVRTMPDLNQRNELMAKYLILNTIWWIEFSGISGIRMDTYPYPDKDFMRDWTCAVMDEYPDFTIVGEEWSLNPAIVSYWQQGKWNHDGYYSCLISLMDFPIQDALVKALQDKENWNAGWIRLYEMLANDFLYADPYQLVVFPDNHDMTRFYTQLGNDMDLYKMGVVFYATVRGIPQFYYGTEIVMDSDANPGDHGLIRSDFPGGWSDDKVNAFNGTGLNKKQQDAQGFLKKILNWRKDNETLHWGDLMQFAPYSGMYSYVRYTDSGKVFVAFNKTDESIPLETHRYAELIRAGTTAYNVLEGRETPFIDGLEVPGKGILLLEFFE